MKEDEGRRECGWDIARGEGHSAGTQCWEQQSVAPACHVKISCREGTVGHRTGQHGVVMMLNYQYAGHVNRRKNNCYTE